VDIEPSLPERLVGLPNKKLLEAIAAELVAAVTGDHLEELDPGGGALQLPDFRILDGPGGTQLGVLEVTTTTRAERLRYAHRVHKQDWQYPTLRWWWLVHTDGSLEPAELRQHLGPLLEAWEESPDGPPVDDWIPTHPGLIHPEAGALPPEFVSLGVVSVTAMGPPGPPGQAWVAVQKQERGGPISRNAAMTNEVQAELDKRDNRQKLQGGDGRAELFVWLDVGDGMMAALTLCEPPFVDALAEVALPLLPEGVTSVWVATGRADWPRPTTALLRSDGHVWEVIPRPILSA
jgi:hypothetical protein